LIAEILKRKSQATKEMLFFIPISPIKELKVILLDTRCKKGGFLPLSTFNGVYAKTLG
jgi:hypothetical protein